MINTVNQFCQGYYNQIPTDGLRAVGLSALFSFTASVLVIACTTPVNQMPNLSRAGVAAGISCLAATIHALTTPIFNFLFNNPNNDFDGRIECMRFVIDITLVHILINHIIAFKINLLMSTTSTHIPHTLVKIFLDMSLKFGEFITEQSLPDIRDMFEQRFHVDFNQNSSPIYIFLMPSL